MHVVLFILAFIMIFTDRILLGLLLIAVASYIMINEANNEGENANKSGSSTQC